MTIIPSFLAVEVAYGTLGEKLSLCGTMVARGMGTVFLVLIILWGIIALFGVAFSTKKSEKAAPAPVSEPEPEVEPEESADESDDAVIAAIVAAIEAYRAEEGKSGLPYRVVSFKRKSGRKSWNSGDAE